ncbi:MAG: ribose 1,5-bisphosphate isomerase [Thermoprotei archaeon]|nr:MAG: ribose 1,5-bisphosphate isomerase [Thermoprotei archaeon]
MSSSNYYDILDKAVEDISLFNIYSSTDVVTTGIEVFIKAFEYSSDINTAFKYCSTAVEKLYSARPTSVMMANSLRRLLHRLNIALDETRDFEKIKDSVKREAEALKQELREAVEAVAIIGSRRINPGETILTISYSGTVYRLFKEAWDRGVKFKVYVVESRPGSEGFYTAKKLRELGIPVTIFVDSAVRYFMKDVDKVITGAEAIAANGAVINKVGTSMIALAAHEARVRVFIASSTHKFSPETIFGELVELTIKRPSEKFIGEAIKELGDVKSILPIFDVTPPEYIDAIITEKGLVAPEAVIFLLRDIYGWPPKFPELDDLLKEIEVKLW